MRPITAEETEARGFSGQWGDHRPTLAQRLLIGAARRSFFGRGALRPWTIARIAARGTPLDVEFRGCRYRVTLAHNLIEAGLLLKPAYNGPEIDFLSAAIRDGGTAVDIGSNIGLYSLPLTRAAGPSGRVIAIDANPAMVNALEFNARASEVSGLSIFGMAVGGASGHARLQIHQDDLAIVKAEEDPEGDITMRPLSDILEEAAVTSVEALKIDIEGGEDAALVPYLDGATDAMRPDRIVIEHPRHSDDYSGCAAAFDRHGYRLVGRTRSNSLYQRG